MSEGPLEYICEVVSCYEYGVTRGPNRQFFP